MGSTHTLGESGGVVPHRPSALTLALGFDAAAVAVFISFVVIVTAGGPRDTSDETFFSDPLPAALLLAAAAAVIAGGVVAAVSLVRSPLRSRVGRLAMWLAVANAVLMPVVSLAVIVVAALASLDLAAGWGEPIVPFWVLTGVSAVIAGAVTREPGRRGLLVVPLMLGAVVLVFLVGEALGHG